MSEAPKPAHDDKPKPEANRRLPLLGALLIVVCLGAAIWKAQEAEVPEPAAPTPLPAQASGRPSLGEMLDQPELVRRAEEAASAVAFSASGPAGKDQVDVCGVGRVKADASGQPEDLATLQQPMRQARERLLQALASSGDEVSRAAGLLIQSSITPLSPEAAVSCVGSGCAPHEAASPVGATTRAAAPPPASALARETLATLAQSTQSAQIYAFALEACEPYHKEGACQMLSSEQWARIDAGNAAPWLQLANQASDRGDAGGVSEALYHVAQSRIVDSRVPSILGLGLSKLAPDTPLLMRVGLANELQGIAVGGMPDYGALSRYCDASELQDSNRQQSCAALAETLVAHGSALFDVVAGASIGQRVGWSAERVQALRDEHDAIYESVLGALPTPTGIWSCDSQQRLSRYLSDVGQYGEMAALRRSLKQSKESVAALAQRHRERTGKELQAVRAEASSASQP